MTTTSPPRRIETENLVLRAWRASDAPLLRDAIDSSLDHLRAWMPWAINEPASLEETFARLAAYAAKFDAGEDFVYGIFNRDETSVLGGTGLHRRIVADGLEIGYWIRVDQVRRGFAVEAARALTEAGLAVPGVVRIQIHCDPANVVSRRIPERLGYHLIEHRSSDTIDPRGLPRDTVVYERALGQPGEGPAVIPEFGTPAATPDIVGRRAAYALIRDDAGRFLAVRAKYGLFLPGGGCEPGEPPELALTREIREEIGHAVSALRHRATAVQHFNTDGVSYCMTADFYTVLLGDRSAGEAEHDMVWLDPNERGDRWYHACHAWAVRRESAGDDI